MDKENIMDKRNENKNKTWVDITPLILDKTYKAAINIFSLFTNQKGILPKHVKDKVILK